MPVRLLFKMIFAPGHSGYPNGNEEYRFFKMILTLLETVGIRNATKWKEVFDQEVNRGSGFLSNDIKIAGVSGYLNILTKIVQLACIYGTSQNRVLEELVVITGKVIDERKNQIRKGKGRADAEEIIIAHQQIVRKWTEVKKKMIKLL